MGLDVFQVVLVLLGAGFIIAGLLGLFPMLTGSRMAYSTPGTTPELSASAQGKDKVAKVAALPPEVKTAPVAAAALAKQSPVAAVAASTPAMAPTRPEDHSAYGAGASALDEDGVEELFAELFALRSSVSTLTHEVRELRSEQRSRRLVLCEVDQAPPTRQTVSASA